MYESIIDYEAKYLLKLHLGHFIYSQHISRIVLYSTYTKFHLLHYHNYMYLSNKSRCNKSSTKT